VDANQNVISRTSLGKIFRKREAARHFGISVSVLQALKDAGIYEVNHLLPMRPGFHQLDLEALNHKFLALVSGYKPLGTAAPKAMTLQSVLCGRHDSTATKLSVVRALLAKKIPVVGNADGTIGGLLLDRFACRYFIADARNTTRSNHGL
jgi:hypothetical protein